MLCCIQYFDYHHTRCKQDYKLKSSATNVASVGSVFNDKAKGKGSLATLRRELVGGGGSGKTTRIFIRVNTKTSRDKIKANQMDFIKTKCKQRSVNRIA